MAIIDKVKELGDEIVKSVEETGIKEKAKSASLLISEVVENSVKEIESKFEENMNRLEAEKQERQRLQESVQLQIKEHYLTEQPSISSMFGTGPALAFYEQIASLYRVGDELRIGIGESNVPKRLLALKQSEEQVIMSYYENSKQYFLLTNRGFYFKAKHPVQGLIYSTMIDSSMINSIKVETYDETAILQLNDVSILVMDGLSAIILEQWLQFINDQTSEVTEELISFNIHKLIQLNHLEAVYDHFDGTEQLLYFVKQTEDEFAICTKTELFMIKRQLEQVSIDMINYEDIQELDSKWKVFGESALDVILYGSKISISPLHMSQAQMLMKIINEKKVAPTVSTSADDVIRLIKALAELKDQGILTTDEFEQKKRDLLNRI